ncbi:hypothetical protein RND81_08G183300 [Saponaria officinalis]|uniref:F-box domain-containing protein n=1 Tax=Saponaria officinalis TaxID=3572 RepID=A0AAW1J8V4_SAPOF
MVNMGSSEKTPPLANIPDDIIHSCILPRLPVKSLLRFKCVSKSWQTLISSPDFIRLHNHHAHSSDRNRFIISTYQSSTYFHILNLDSPLDRPPILHYPKTETLNSDVLATIVASCEFFLLILVKPFRGSYKLFLTNPSTRSYHEIPCQKLAISLIFVKFGLYHDKANDDYKVIRIISVSDNEDNPSGCTWETMIYSFKTNSWRLVERKLKPSRFYNVLNLNAYVVNNLLHILLTTINHGNENVRIGCFDIQAEQWTNDIPLPDYNLYNYRLRVLDGSLCVLGNEGFRTGAYSVWVMKDGWVKLMSMDIKYAFYEYYPITYRTGSRHELLCKRCGYYELYWYNLQDKVDTYAASNKSADAESGYRLEHVCRGSLVTFANKLQLPKQDDIVGPRIFI